MKKIFLLSISLIFLISILGLKCSKDPEERPIYYLDQEIKDYTLFPVGSYWVYIDTVSGKTDTNSVIKQIREIKHNRNSFKFEYIWFLFNSSYDDDTIDHSLSSRYLKSSKICHYSIQETRKCFLSNMLVGGERYSVVYEGYHDSLFVQEKWFNEVKVFYETNHNRRYYFAKNIGIIKKTSNEHFWELSDYFINE